VEGEGAFELLPEGAQDAAGHVAPRAIPLREVVGGAPLEGTPILDRAPRPGPRRPGCGELAVRFPVTVTIAAVTLLFFGLEALFGGTTDLRAQLRLGALRGDLVYEHGELYRLLCAAFLHHSFVHLGFNGFAFLQLGALTEHVYGRWRTVAIYLACALTSSLASATFMEMAPGGSRGASGAIMGLAGLLLVASWTAHEPTRGNLRALFGRRLLIGVLLTFGLGLGALLVFPIIDNWGHLGGFLGGVAFALVLRRPERPAGPGFKAAAVGLTLLTLASFAWMALDGRRAADAFGADMARYLAEDLEEADGYAAAGMMVEVVRAGHVPGEAPSPAAAQAALEALGAILPRCADAQTPLMAASILMQEPDADPFGPAIGLLLERAHALAPEQPEVLNALAWHLVTGPTVALRDPARAQALSERSLELLGDAAEARAMRAAYLDTQAEALLQLDRWSDALEHQREAVQIAREVGADGDLRADLELRWARILAHEGLPGEALAAAQAALEHASEANRDRAAMQALIDRLQAPPPR
jgi:rhomboid protease GluP